LVTVSPERVVFESSTDENGSREVHIKAEVSRPLTLVPGPHSLPEEVTYRIEEIEKGKRFKVVFQKVPGGSGRFHGFLRLQTGYPEKPEIRILIMGNPPEARK
jgi:hypothetical protein